MITLEQAKKLCIEAHNGQWRRPIELTKVEVEEISGISPLLDKQQFKFEDGSKIIWDDLCEEYLYYIPYHTHPITVADMMSTDDEKVLAYLHDVVEDCEGWDLFHDENRTCFWLAAPDGANYELPYDIWLGLKMLTHKEGEPYLSYIDLICQTHKMAIKVKLADMFHNMSSGPSDRQKQKYMEAIPMLLKAL